MDQAGAYITLSECVYRIAAATGEWPEYAKAKTYMLQATLDGTLTIYGVPRFLHQPEPIPAHAFSKPLFLPSLELLSLVKNPHQKRFPANRVLQKRIGHLLTRPVGRPPNAVRRSYANFSYQAGSWTNPRRVVVIR